MNSTRFKILAGVALVLLAMLLWNWISGWGLVTVHGEGQPLAKIIRSIERQGGIKIVTNADLTTPVTMDVDRVPVAEAVDTLAAWLDGNWSVSYAIGPKKSDVVAGVAALQEGGRRIPDFVRFGGGGFGGGMDLTDTVIDVRRVAWTVSPADKPELQAYLGQLSAKTGLAAITPEAWNPAIDKAPKGGPAASALKDLVKSARGEMQEVFVIRVETEDRVADAGAGGGNPGGGGRPDGGFGGGGGGGNRGNFNPEWIAERAEARIALLPAAERTVAKKEFDEMRENWEKIRTLPEAERRAAMEQMFNSPVMQERMMERQMSRDAKRSPEKRAERFRRYIERKQQMKASS